MVLFVLAMRVMGAGRCRGVRNQVFAFNGSGVTYSLHCGSLFGLTKYIIRIL